MTAQTFHATRMDRANLPTAAVSGTVTSTQIVMPCTFLRPPLTKNKARRMAPIVQAKAIRPIRDEAHIRAKAIMAAVKAAGWTVPYPDPVYVNLIWTPPRDRIRRDASSGQPTLEAWIDGLTVGTGRWPGAGLLLDDRHEIVVQAWCSIEDAERPGCRVVITKAA